MSYDLKDLAYAFIESSWSESMRAEERAAVRSLGRQLTLTNMSGTKMECQFSLALTTKRKDREYSLVLRVGKGSLCTTIFNPWGRVDDEYMLLLREHNVRPKPTDSVSEQVLWSVKGLDPTCFSANICNIMWPLFRQVQSLLQIWTVGVLSFAKLLSIVLLSTPIFLGENAFQLPMPAVLM
jgi:hypothetical protein